jgi:predicted nucleic acid-binding protein
VKPWIVNASPLILLGKINRLDLLSALAPGLAIPESVAREVRAGPDSDPAKLWLQHDADPVVPDSAITTDLLAWDLGAGETAVIALAPAKHEAICVLDDLAARKCAAVYGLQVIGTLGILLRPSCRARFQNSVPNSIPW